MKCTFVRAVAFALFAAGPAWGAGGGPDTTRDGPKDPAVEAIQDAIAKPDWARARELSRASVARDPANADYHNLYAYTIRMGAKPELELVFKHYNEALRLDPKHLGAHEYLGEVYLTVGNLAKAKEHLRRLDDLCFFGCKEYSMLKKAVADYEAKRPAK